LPRLGLENIKGIMEAAGIALDLIKEVTEDIGLALE
jgi:hypothetical protein